MGAGVLARPPLRHASLPQFSLAVAHLASQFPQSERSFFQADAADPYRPTKIAGSLFAHALRAAAR